MTIVLDHTIVPARDKEQSARFFAHIFGLEYNGPVSHFAPVRINETLTIDFDNWDSFERHHYAFKVSEAEFDGIFDLSGSYRLAFMLSIAAYLCGCIAFWALRRPPVR